MKSTQDPVKGLAGISMLFQWEGFFHIFLVVKPGRQKQRHSQQPNPSLGYCCTVLTQHWSCALPSLLMYLESQVCLQRIATYTVDACYSPMKRYFLTSFPDTDTLLLTCTSSNNQLLFSLLRQWYTNPVYCTKLFLHRKWRSLNS